MRIIGPNNSFKGIRGAKYRIIKEINSKPIKIKKGTKTAGLPLKILQVELNTFAAGDILDFKKWVTFKDIIYNVYFLQHANLFKYNTIFTLVKASRHIIYLKKEGAKI